MSTQEILPVGRRPSTALGQMPLSDPQSRGFELWGQTHSRATTGRRLRPRPRRDNASSPAAEQSFAARLDLYA